MNALADLRSLVGGLAPPAAGLLAERIAAWREPHAELLALVWGTRFDRDHAQQLLRAAALDGAPAHEAWRALMDAADRFDSLPGADQQRVRRLILAGQRRQSAPCLASC